MIVSIDFAVEWDHRGTRCRQLSAWARKAKNVGTRSGDQAERRHLVASKAGDIEERRQGPRQRGICSAYVVVRRVFASMESLWACINSPREGMCKGGGDSDSLN